jgi:ABC-2 type transport system ATP-binding protein
MEVLSIQGISKAYGKIQALKNVSYHVPKGSVFGILGPNGSGKTTMLGIILNVLQSDNGNFTWFGKPGSEETRKRIGSLLETPNFYHYLSAYDNLKITQAISKRGTEKDIHKALEIVKLTERKYTKFSTYSLGMKQRLAIASALLGNPEVIVFDEPTNGLDPVGIVEIRELIKELAKNGITIIMASHLLDEVEKVCTHVAIMKKGNLVVSGNVNEVLSNEDIVEVQASSNNNIAAVLQNISGVTKVVEEDGYVKAFFELGTANLANINQQCFNNGITLQHLVLKKKSLEAKFFELTNN